jgi:nitric oxide synthase-interacting protein
MRECDACYLCLQRARDPVCCSQGHLYCKECILENILAQKKEILRQQKLLEVKAKDEEEEAKRKAELAKEAVIQEFERQQLRITPANNEKGADNNTNGSSLTNESNAKKEDVNKSPEALKSVDGSVKAIEWTESSSSKGMQHSNFVVLVIISEIIVELSVFYR